MLKALREEQKAAEEAGNENAAKTAKKEIKSVLKAIAVAKRLQPKWIEAFQMPLDAKIGVQMDREVLEYCRAADKGKTKRKKNIKIVHTRHLTAFGSVAFIVSRINKSAMAFFENAGIFLFLLLILLSSNGIYVYIFREGKNNSELC